MTSVNDSLMYQGSCNVPTWGRDTSGNVTGLVGPDGSVIIGGALCPTGNDQASEIEQYINDTAGDYAATLAAGEFIIGSPLALYSRKNYGTKWGEKGIGIALKGAGAANTKILYTGDKASPCFLITDPGSTATEISLRNTFGEFSGFSLLSATALGV